MKIGLLLSNVTLLSYLRGALSFGIAPTDPTTAHRATHRPPSRGRIVARPTTRASMSERSDEAASAAAAAAAPADIRAISIPDAPAPVGPYSQAVLAGNVLYCSGQVALDPTTGLMVGNGDVEAETRQALSNLSRVLTAGGVTTNSVVRTTVFLADLSDFDRVNAIYSDFFDGPVPPARACVQVAALPKGARVEIDCIAVL